MWFPETGVHRVQSSDLDSQRLEALLNQTVPVWPAVWDRVRSVDQKVEVSEVSAAKKQQLKTERCESILNSHINL